MVWEINKRQNEQLKLEVYKFINDYNEVAAHNESGNLNAVTRPYLVLDGQQRLTALLVGLRGSYSYKSYNQIRKQKLFINLIADLENDPDNIYGLKYELKFLDFNRPYGSTILLQQNLTAPKSKQQKLGSK